MRRITYRSVESNHCASQIELVMRFVLWMQEQQRTGRMPTYRDVMRRFDMHRSTANRWYRDYFSAHNTDIPRSAATDRTTAAPAQRTSP